MVTTIVRCKRMAVCLLLLAAGMSGVTCRSENEKVVFDSVPELCERVITMHEFIDKHWEKREYANKSFRRADGRYELPAAPFRSYYRNEDGSRNWYFVGVLDGDIEFKTVVDRYDNVFLIEPSVYDDDLLKLSPAELVKRKGVYLEMFSTYREYLDSYMDWPEVDYELYKLGLPTSVNDKQTVVYECSRKGFDRINKNYKTVSLDPGSEKAKNGQLKYVMLLMRGDAYNRICNDHGGPLATDIEENVYYKVLLLAWIVDKEK